MTRWRQLLIIAVAGTAVAIGCVAAARTGDGDRTVSIPVIPDDSFVGPPAPIEIDQDSLAGQIVAKLEARMQVMLSAVANVASGNTTYFSWAVAGVMALGWASQFLTTRQVVRLSHEREMKRIECSIAPQACEHKEK